MTNPLPDPIRAFDDAQRRAIGMLRDITSRLEAGMAERDIFELAETRLQDHGFDRWFHAPHVHVGPRSRLPTFGRRKLEPGSLLSVDIGPATAEAYGDIGTTIQFGASQEPAVLDVARRCVRACCGYASRWKTVGEVYVFAKAWAVNHRMELAEADAIGHRVLPKEGLLSTGWPRSAHAATLLARNRVHRLHPIRMAGMFAIRPTVVDGAGAATFEEIVYVQDDVRKVLGRDRIEDAGTL